MISIAIFNNKGGVGKTSLLCNLAAYLKVRLNKRVLIVDADPQCNATIYVTPEEELEEIWFFVNLGGNISSISVCIK